MNDFNNLDTLQNVTGLIGGNNTTDMSKAINAVYCSAGLGGDTALLIDDTITTMESMYNFRSGTSLPTYAIGDTGVVESHMMSIPMDNIVEQAQDITNPMYQQKQMYLDNIRADSQLSDKSKHGMKMMYANELWIITFDNDFHISCTDGTQFLAVKEDGSYDWKHAKDLKVGDKMVGAEVGDEAKIDVVDVHVTSCKLHKCIAREPVYLFMCEHQNILLPNIKNNRLSFICVHQ